ncbi:sulfurtransferase TusA family protein [Natranaerofaba carboxydovora]|uniref:sulfurtransferase TusA family protein n=1 Tax=Natranaerofaba carboxydovora TaxID=2742683 RepID=UPI001F14350C|nr:sulfurtransferase TusA family protein [Natranaerofaba carboxydovora]UMZ72693.1 Sulfite reductase [ferredoxin] [Natranaerofaba carboxydovora]
MIKENLTPTEVTSDLYDFRNKLNEYLEGKMEDFRFKPYRVARGVYEQRKSGTYMIRTRIVAGEVSLEQLKEIVRLADNYASKNVHLTTRQDVQLHDVRLEDTAEVIEGLLEVGILTKGTGGNTPRNVVASPLSGVSSDEVFDVTPYARLVTRHFLTDPSSFNLPRKYKIAFSNSEKDTANALVADLGFIAVIRESDKSESGYEKGFIVYGGGGLGNNPSCGIKLKDFVPVSEVLYYAEAMKRFFEAEGDRTNKNKARIRHILIRLGEEKFTELFEKKLQEVKEDKQFDLKVLENNDNNDQQIDAAAAQVTATQVDTKSTDEKEELLIKQKQPGYYSVYLHPENGNISTTDLKDLIDFLESIDDSADIRISNTQGLYVRNLRKDDAVGLLKIFKELIYPYKIDNSIACAGASTCKLGLCLSQNLLKSIKEKFENVNPFIKSQLPRAYISGCPNSCGQHQIGKLAFSGIARRTKDGLVPTYVVHFNGKVGTKNPKLAQKYGEIPAKKLPKFLLNLARLKYNNGNRWEFEKFVQENETEVTELIEKYSVIEPYDENPDLYYDVGATELFSIEGRSPGECSLGIMEVIRTDIENARENLEQNYLYEASISAARALLVLRGIDTNKDREIFKAFVDHFVKEGYLKADIEDLTGILLDYKLGDISSLEAYQEDIKYLVKKVEDMYGSLNPKLEITLPKEDDEESDKDGSSGSSGDGSRASSSKDNIQDNIQDNIDGEGYEIVDLRGVKCPMNFAKVKVSLSTKEPGDVVGFYLDQGEPMDNVPKSVEGEGHTIKEIKEFDGYSLLVIEKAE